MIIIRESPFSGKVHQWDLPVTEEELSSWCEGTLVQDAFPWLSPEQREFIKTGIIPDEWPTTTEELK